MTFLNVLILATRRIFRNIWTNASKKEMATRKHKVNPYPVVMDIDGRRTIIDESAGDLGI